MRTTGRWMRGLAVAAMGGALLFGGCSKSMMGDGRAGMETGKDAPMMKGTTGTTGDEGTMTDTTHNGPTEAR